MNLIFICPLSQVILWFISFVFQLIALFADYWGYFEAKTDQGLPQEKGHYGLWGICSIKAPVYRDDCDPLDTFFRPPHHMVVAGVVASLQTLLFALFLPFLKSISREQFIFKTSAAENYHITNGWAFWLEVTALVINISIIMLCLLEMNRLNRLEALGFTAFIANQSPHTIHNSFSPNLQSLSDDETNHISIISDPSADGWNRCNQQNCQLFNKTYPNLPFQSISFNNPAFLPDSPDLRQHKPFINHFEII
ncbi:unnamed protein product [Oppiella nova]|uniref:Uncharacterized protein n=1 Tax=Oppiella nova TaxID=334625 RepID=A0A7R9M6M0_9ACAR|nr:unnamed protein product [Oppiella nova]CAG2171751.1 unnamed protein product [Oppiella nova]